MKLLAKIILGGDGGVGKTTLIHRYITNSFIDSTKLTIGAAFHTHEIEYDEHTVLVQIWDLGGQEQFKQMGLFSKYFKGASVSVIMFDLTRLSTIDSIPFWADLAKNASNCKLVLVGGKKDLAQGLSFKKEDFAELFEKYNFVEYHETSSATGDGVPEVFQAIAKAIVDQTIKKKNNGNGNGNINGNEKSNITGKEKSNINSDEKRKNRLF
ncbi:MAG: Rab family GTPase [Candidatus Heimdallarchaeota archaeon]